MWTIYMYIYWRISKSGHQCGMFGFFSFFFSLLKYSFYYLDQVECNCCLYVCTISVRVVNNLYNNCCWRFCLFPFYN